MSSKIIFWDFDGTLAQRPFMWSNAFLQSLDELIPKHEISIDQIKPLLQRGFPWHTPEIPWNEITPESWWARMECHFSEVFRELKIDNKICPELSRKVRNIAIDPKSY